jgi:hypothetical protein
MARRRKRRKRAAPPTPDILELDAGASFYTPANIDQIIEATRLPLPQSNITFSHFEEGPGRVETPPMDRRTGLRYRLNRAAAFWTVVAEKDEGNPKRPRTNEPWRHFVKDSLAEIFETIFEAKPTANPTRKGGKSVVSSPFTRFVVAASRPLDQVTTEEAVRDILRNKQPAGGIGVSVVPKSPG